MSTSKDPATKSNPEKKLTDKDLDKASGGHGSPTPVGGPGTTRTRSAGNAWQRIALHEADEGSVQMIRCVREYAIYSSCACRPIGPGCRSRLS